MKPKVPYPLHKPEPPATYVEAYSRKRRRWALAIVIVMLLLMLVGFALAILGIYGVIRLQKNSAQTYPARQVNEAYQKAEMEVEK